MSQQKCSSPCDGIQVVELSTSMVSGPMCGQILGDLGADVIRLEGGRGDMMRAIPPVRSGLSGSFVQFNRNKRSIVVDLTTEGGREVAWTLIGRADVLIENFRPGVAEAMGFGYAAVAAKNERLIYASVSGFGSDGPYATYPAYDQVIQGLVGFMPIQGSKERPEAIKSVIVDKVTALAAANAILAALLQRERGGCGQRVDVPMLDAFAAIILPELMARHAFPDETGPVGEAPDVYRPLRTRDGHLVGLIAQDRQFTSVCKILGREDLLAEPRYATAPQRFAAMPEIIGELEKKARDWSSADLLAALRETKDVAIAPVNSIEDFLEDPQVQHNRTIFMIEDPDTGPIRQIKSIANLHGSAPPPERRAPKLGEHTKKILCEIGFSDQKVGELLLSKAVMASD